jgi:hypothetical protein
VLDGAGGRFGDDGRHAGAPPFRDHDAVRAGALRRPMIAPMLCGSEISSHTTISGFSRRLFRDGQNILYFDV